MDELERMIAELEARPDLNEYQRVLLAVNRKVLEGVKRDAELFEQRKAALVESVKVTAQLRQFIEEQRKQP